MVVEYAGNYCSPFPPVALMFHLQINDHLELTQRHVEDAEEIFALTDANREHLRQWLPWLDVCRTAADTLSNIRSCLHQVEDGTGLGLSIREDGKIVGLISYNFIDKWNRMGQIGYWLGAAYQGRGIMTTACRALVDYGFAKFALHRQTICAATGNLRSRSIAERLGFRLEGIAHDAEWLYGKAVDHALYGLLRGEWEAMRRFPQPQGVVPCDDLVMTGGLIYFARMLDKIRLHAGGLLPEGYFTGDEDPTHFDARCCRFLGIRYADLVPVALTVSNDEDVLDWCFAKGRRPSAEEIVVWNAFLAKRGWRDDSSAALVEAREACGLGYRLDVQTWIDLHRAEEGRKPQYPFGLQ